MLHRARCVADRHDEREEGWDKAAGRKPTVRMRHKGTSHIASNRAPGPSWKLPMGKAITYHDTTRTRGVAMDATRFVGLLETFAESFTSLVLWARARPDPTSHGKPDRRCKTTIERLEKRRRKPVDWASLGERLLRNEQYQRELFGLGVVQLQSSTR